MGKRNRSTRGQILDIASNYIPGANLVKLGYNILPSNIRDKYVNIEYVKDLVNLSDKKNNESILQLAIKNKYDLAIIKYLVEKGADVNAKGGIYSRSVLHDAVAINTGLNIIKYLVDNGADVNAKDDNSWSVLDQAIISKNKLNVIKYLIEKGAVVKSKM